MRENWSSGFSTKSDTNRPIQAQKRARVLKFWILEEEGLYFPSSENKDADHLPCSGAVYLYMTVIFKHVYWDV